MATFSVLRVLVNIGCIGLGLSAGMVMRDETYYPNLHRTLDLVEDHERRDQKIEEEIILLKQRVKEIRKERKNASKKL